MRRRAGVDVGQEGLPLGIKRRAVIGLAERGQVLAIPGTLPVDFDLLNRALVFDVAPRPGGDGEPLWALWCLDPIAVAPPVLVGPGRRRRRRNNRPSGFDGSSPARGCTTVAG